ncbi:hypothetical protein L195_g056107, partial [Trifolium pratense]
LSDDALVSDLIDEHTRQWNRSLIFNFFTNDEALKIVSTPLSISLPADNINWRWEKDGLYSVRNCWLLEWLSCSDKLGARNQSVFKRSPIEPGLVLKDLRGAVILAEALGLKLAIQTAINQ